MSKLKSLGGLQVALDDSISWRVKEIANLKMAIKSSGSLSEETLIRAGVAISYSHWEGFVKDAAENYLDFVAGQRLTFDELSTCFVVLGLKSHLTLLIESRNVLLNIEAIKYLRENGSTRAHLTINDVIKTHSNLNDEVFCNIVDAIGLDKYPYEPYFNFIRKELLGRRNAIAHGEDTRILRPDKTDLRLSRSGFMTLADQVADLLRKFKNDVENAAALQKYKAQ